MMSKLIRKIICLAAIMLLAMGAAVCGAEESSIDSVDQGVAATGKSQADKSKPITECRTPYAVAVLPYVDASGLEGRSREMAANAVKVALKTKYPGKSGSVNKIASAKAVQQALKAYPFENADDPVLEELVQIGKAMGVDRVIYINMQPARMKESGFMVIGGTQTYSATISMKLKCVDVNEGRYLFNQLVEDVGSSTSINFWRIGSASKAKAVKRGTENCMRVFLTAFD
jgi:hypothetical protein